MTSDTFHTAAIDLYDASKVMMRQRYNLTEDLWENLQNAVNRLDAARQAEELDHLPSNEKAAPHDNGAAYQQTK